MKLKHIFSLLAGVLLLFAACSPDDYSMGGAQYDPEDLVEGKAYSVTVGDDNRIHLKSLLTDCKPLWITPNGRSQEEELTLEMPFAGDYEITFGADTRAGAVYGEPYKFTLTKNNFGLLSDEKWFQLTDANHQDGDKNPDEATIQKGVKKRWYPIDADYSSKLGNSVNGPLAMMTPYDPDNDGQGFTDDEKANLVYKDIPYGRANWSCNWGPGLTNSWFMLADNAYLDSYMELSLDATDGCVATIYRAESGTKTTEKRWEKSLSELSSTGTVTKGKFNLNLVNKDKPTISFSGCELLHPSNYDGVCSNYTQELQIIELSDYYMAIAAKRTNSEGNWYIIFHFMSVEVPETEGGCIPSDPVLDSELTPVLPEFPNLTTQLYTTSINDVTFVGNELTYVINEEEPYDILTWNGAWKNSNGTKVGRWDSAINPTGISPNYGTNWAPKCDEDAISDISLTIGHKTEENINDNNKNPKTYMTWNDGTNSGVFFVDDDGQTVSFTDVCAASTSTGKIPEDFKPTDISFLKASNSYRTINIKGNKFQVFSIDTEGGTLQLGVPDKTSKNEDGDYTRYFVVNLKQKAVGGGSTGPTTIKVDADKVNNYMQEDGKYFRCQLYNPWGGGNDAIDPTTVKVKNKQTLSVTFKLSGFTFSQSAKAVLCFNEFGDETDWEPNCFDYSRAITVNGDGTYTVLWTNTTGSTANWGNKNSCVTIAMQYDGYATVQADADGSYKSACTIESMAIQ